MSNKSFTERRRKMKQDMKNILIFSVIPILFIIGMTTSGWGAGYPERPINLIVPFPPGGAGDLGARVVASFLEGNLKQTIVVENKPGGNNLIGGNLVASAKPDGYILGYLSIVPAIPETFVYFQKPTYSSKDLTPICPITNVPGALIVKDDSPWKTIKEFVEYARKNPRVKVGTRGPGSIPQLMLLGIQKAENVTFTDVPFPGDAPITTAVLGGHILAGISSYGTVRSQVEAGNLRILLLYTKKRLEIAPNIPCVSDVGYEPPVYPFFGLFGPKDLPSEIVKKIDGAVKQVIEDPRFRERITKSLGFELIYEDPENFKKTLKKYQTGIEGFYKELGYWKE
jgi:tripartite-type tricarboxylate transporter receptor subunit TctC